MLRKKTLRLCCFAMWDKFRKLFFIPVDQTRLHLQHHLTSHLSTTLKIQGLVNKSEPTNILGYRSVDCHCCICSSAKSSCLCSIMSVVLLHHDEHYLILDQYLVEDFIFFHIMTSKSYVLTWCTCKEGMFQTFWINTFNAKALIAEHLCFTHSSHAVP
jgi:hypothetical protein